MAKKDYIERGAVLLKIDIIGTNKFGMLDEDIREFINKFPSADVVEVVRCKNCEYRTSECEPEHGRTQHYCTKNKISVKRDFFCGYGKRKE